MFFIAFIFLSSVAGNTLSVEVTVFIVLLFQNEKFILNIELVDTSILSPAAHIFAEELRINRASLFSLSFNIFCLYIRSSLEMSFFVMDDTSIALSQATLLMTIVSCTKKLRAIRAIVIIVNTGMSIAFSTVVAACIR